MGNFSKDRFSLIAQGITGSKLWDYTDTGAIGSIQEDAGFLKNAGDMGVDTGDFVIIHATNGGTTQVVYGSAMSVVQDTGATQGTAGLAVLIGDTS